MTEFEEWYDETFEDQAAINAAVANSNKSQNMSQINKSTRSGVSINVKKPA